MPPDAILQGLDAGDVSALARAISLVENQRDGFERVLTHVHERLGRGAVRRIGITGPPGAGKSTLTEQLIRSFRGVGLKVAVVAVDPTSPFSGGALLGDRIRMETASTDPGVFIRSMATRGSIGGLATTTEEVCDVLEAFGFERILIETVGVGQTELDVARSAETTVLVLVPESGDGIQALKAGVMEVADVYVINKADRPGAERMQREIEIMLGIRRGSAYRHVGAHHRADGRSGGRPDANPTARPSDRPTASGDRPTAGLGAWEPPVLQTVAPKGEGVPALIDALDRHRTYLESSGRLALRRRERLAERTRAAVNRAVQQWVWEGSGAEALLAQALDDMTAGTRSPYEVAAEILEQAKSGAPR
jgi:GTPase